MRLLLTLLTVCLWQITYCSTSGNSNTFLSKQESMVGFQSKKYEISFRRPLTVSYFLTDSVSEKDMYNKGRQDAKIFYKNRGAFWVPFGVTVGSLLAPPVFFLPGAGTGLYFLPGLGTSLYKGLTKPKERNLKNHDIRYRNMELIEPTDRLFQDSLYVEGYRKGAQQRKLGKAAGGFGAGLGVTFLLIISLAVAAMS